MKKILFNDKFLLTQAVLEGRKTQTRRIIPKDFFSLTWDKRDDTLVYENGMGDFIDVRNSKYAQYKVGEVVAVAQRMCDVYAEWDMTYLGKDTKALMEKFGGSPGFNNKMFVKASEMPHQIRIADVRVERLQDISDECCLKEGIIKKWHAPACKNYYYVPGIEVKSVKDVHDTPQEAFAHLINKVSGKDIWSENPYVFVYDFKLIK